jgi:hypothetical protein
MKRAGKKYAGMKSAGMKLAGMKRVGLKRAGVNRTCTLVIVSLKMQEDHQAASSTRSTCLIH